MSDKDAVIKDEAMKVYMVTSNDDDLIIAAYAFADRKTAAEKVAALKVLCPKATVTMQIDTVISQAIIDNINDVLSKQGYQNV